MELANFSKMQLPTEVRSQLVLIRKGISRLNRSHFRNDHLYGPASHLLKHGGKLMRPTLVMLGAYAIGGSSRDFVDMAVSVELLHTSSLIHDDIVDGDRKRRGVETVHVKYGAESAILAGDALIAKSIEVSAKYGEEVMNAMSQSSMDMCAGESLDYNFQRLKSIPTVSEYQNVATLKSASLIATCCSLPAVYRKNKLARRLYQFGENMGIAFQMRDDILDFSEGNGNRNNQERFRPNIVATLKTHKSLSGRDALRSAIELHGRYISNAVISLSGISRAKILAEYAESIRIIPKA